MFSDNISKQTFDLGLALKALNARLLFTAQRLSQIKGKRFGYLLWIHVELFSAHGNLFVPLGCFTVEKYDNI